MKAIIIILSINLILTIYFRFIYSKRKFNLFEWLGCFIFGFVFAALLLMEKIFDVFEFMENTKF